MNTSVPFRSFQRCRWVRLGAGALGAWLMASASAPAETAQVLPLNLSFENIGIVTSLARQDDGKLIVGGTFQLANGATRWNLARFNPDGTLDAGWKPQPDSEVRVVAVSGTNIYAGGYFLNIGGLPRACLAKLDYTTGAADPAWNPAANNVVSAIVARGPYLYVGGAFTSIGGLARAHVARLNAAGAADPAWSATVNDNVGALAADASHVYIAGDFTMVDGLLRAHLARLSAINGQCDMIWDPNPNDVPYAILLNGTEIYVGGAFTLINGQGRAHLAQLNATDGAPTTWAVDADDAVVTISAFGDHMLVGGRFNTIGGAPRSRLALVHFLGYTEISWTNGVNGWLSAATASGTNEAYIGGYFQAVGADPAWSIARLVPATGAKMTAFNGRINLPGSIYAIDRQADGKILLGGDFAAINGAGFTNLCRLNADYTLDAAFKPNPDNIVRALNSDDTGIYAGGRFSTIGGVPRAHLAKLQLDDGAVDASFWADTDADVYVITRHLFALYVGGLFTTIGGQGRNKIAKLYPSDGTVDSTFNLGANNTVHAILAAMPDLWVGGSFTAIGGGAHNRIAKLDANTGAANPAFTQGADSDVYALAIEETEFYAGGFFNTIGGAAHKYIAKLDPETGAADPRFTASSSDFVSSLAFTFYDLYIGGAFTNLSGATRRGLAQLDISTGAVAPLVADADSMSGYVRSIVHAGAYLLVGGDFTEINGANSPCFAVIARHLPPAVALTAPVDGQRIAALGAFELGASATADNISGIIVTQVAFYANGSLVGTLTGEPYQLAVSDIPEGAYRLTARAWDSDGLCATSAPVMISVSPLPVPGDYDGDRKADPALFVNSPNPGLVGNWYAWLSGSGYQRVGPYAISPVRQLALGADFDGDGLADPAACYSGETDLAWTAWLSSDNYTEVGPFGFGQIGDSPLAADFDGDRKADPAGVDGAGAWTAWLSARDYAPAGPYTTFSGVEVPLTADFDGDGKADPAGYQAGVLWAWLSGSNYAPVSAALYVAGGIPAAADYDGDGKADPAVYVPATDPGTSGAWYAWLSTAGYAQSGPYPLTAP